MKNGPILDWYIAVYLSNKFLPLSIMTISYTLATDTNFSRLKMR
jgi:hypothetical protein